MNLTPQANKSRGEYRDQVRCLDPEQYLGYPMWRIEICGTSRLDLNNNLSCSVHGILDHWVSDAAVIGCVAGPLQAPVKLME